VLSTLIPGNVPVDDEAERRLLALLDGTRDRPALAARLAITLETLEQALQRLVGHGLISR
jgi:predicted transcriptional regulator